LVVGLIGSAVSIRVVKQFERGVVFRFGRVRASVRGPGLAVLVPIADRLQKVNMQIITMPVPAQDGITRDNVTVRVDAVVYFSVIDPVRAAVDVQDYISAIGQVAQTSLRSIIGKSDLDDLLSNRERLNQGMELMIDSPALDWGVHIERVEIKDVALPETMKRSMSRQAEAERERRARVITADSELQASEKLGQAAEVMTAHPAALQLRLLQTVVEVAAEKNSTLVLPFPVELLRFLERSTPAENPKSTATPAPAAAAATAAKNGSPASDLAKVPEIEQSQPAGGPVSLDRSKSQVLAATRPALYGAALTATPETAGAGTTSVGRTPRGLRRPGMAGVSIAASMARRQPWGKASHKS
jgi:regulator of protease activity HflC (stomatin/prohibitin superfamily)